MKPMNPSRPEPESIQPTEPDELRLDHTSLLAHLHKVPILASLSEEDLGCVEDVEQIHLGTDEVIARQGETAEFFFILLSGSIRLFYKKPDGSEMTAVVLPAGTAFGEVPLLANIANPASVATMEPSHLLRFTVEEFWQLMTACPQVRKAILGNMAMRLQRMQTTLLQQEKMASLGTLAAGLMHELNNPGAAARRAASQLRENLMRLHELAARFTKTEMNREQKDCLIRLQEQALSVQKPLELNSLEQSDAEEALAAWMEGAEIANAWKLAPTLVSIGMKAEELDCARASFPAAVFSDCLAWLEALVSSMQLVGTIEESIGRVTTLVGAVKSYAYEGKGQRQAVNVNESLYATLMILGHKMREKQITLEKRLDKSMPLLESTCSGLNQIWTNVLDNAIDAVSEKGRIRISTWAEERGEGKTDLCISIEDDGPGIPLEVQPHIFDPFYTTKPVGVGTGLGLGIAHRIVEQYGGTMRFTSGPGSTVFFVRLPAKGDGMRVHKAT
jgi:signal transduction histidine kinase